MLATRVLTALIALPLVIAGVLFLPTTAVALVFAALMLVGAWEWGALMRLDLLARGVFVAVTAVVMVCIGLTRSLEFGVGSEDLVMGLACTLWVAAILFILRFPQGWQAAMSPRPVSAVVGIIALCAPVAAITYLHQADNGPLLVLVLLFLVWAADTGAYFAGKMFGRHKLAPRVSPGKTREGALGGIVLAVVIAVIGAFVLGYDGSRTLAMVLLGAWVAVMSIVGDLTLSMFKRSAGLKDSGTLFPGHGGALDRLDSLLAAAPWFVVALHWLPTQF